MALVKHPARVLKLRLFGGFEARLSSGAILRFSTTKTQALLAYLALESHVEHLRAKLATLLWGGVRDEHARNSLRHALHDMRRVLQASAPRALLIRGESVALDLANIDVDVVRFDRLISGGSFSAIREAFDLHRGELLEGIVIDEEPFDQ